MNDHEEYDPILMFFITFFFGVFGVHHFIRRQYATLGIKVDIPTALILSLLSAVSACGASGVAGGSLLLIPLACSLFGISNDKAMQMVGVGFIIGVIQDSCETGLNSSTDALLTATAEFKQWKKEGRKLPI